MTQPSHEAPGAAFDWDACVRAARAGDADALGLLLQACAPFLLGIAEKELASDLRPKASASDLVQETCLDAHRDFARFPGATEEDVRAWLRQVLLHNIGDLRRRFREADKRDVAREASVDEYGGEARNQAHALPDDTPSPSSRAGQREEERLVEAALARMPEDYRKVVYLRHRDRRSFVEIGQLMGRSEDAVQKLWERAIERLRQELREAP